MWRATCTYEWKSKFDVRNTPPIVYYLIFEEGPFNQSQSSTTASLAIPMSLQLDDLEVSHLPSKTGITGEPPYPLAFQGFWLSSSGPEGTQVLSHLGSLTLELEEGTAEMFQSSTKLDRQFCFTVHLNRSLLQSRVTNTVHNKNVLTFKDTCTFLIRNNTCRMFLYKIQTVF